MVCNTLINSTIPQRVGIRNISDYSPFGVLLKERTVENEFFRRSFNGMEIDSEVKGSGNSYDFGSRMLDPRVGKWLSIDPKSAVFPFESNFVFTSDNPILYLDIEGEFKIPIHVEITLTALAMERPWNYALIVSNINQTYTEVLNGETQNAINKLKNLDAKTSENFALGMAYGVSIEADIFGCLNAENHFDGMKYQKISENWGNIDNKLNTMKIERSFGSGAEFGKALHAVEDFYAHSNYIELYVEYYKSYNGGKVPNAEDIPLFQDVIKIDKKFKAILEEKLVTGHMDIPTYVGDQVMGTDTDIQQTHEEGEVHHDDIAKDNAEMGKEIKGTNGTLNTFEAAKTVAMKNARLYINKRLREDGTK